MPSCSLGWAFYLNLAESYGWRPAGTLPPESATDGQWSGWYDSSNGQHVSRNDATALAVALRLGLADPEREAKETALAAMLTRDLTGARGRPPVSPVQAPGDDALLRQLIAFCELGGFRID